MSKKTEPKIVVIGGGTGSFTLLQELKKLTPSITSIVNMSDDGGSTGTLRDELGVLPPGDIRQCLVALSDTPEVRDLFDYRFNKGSLKNQSLGNVILSGLELKYGSFAEAVSVASRLLHIQGRVLPVTMDNHALIMRDANKIIRGQSKVRNYKTSSRELIIEHDPPAIITVEATEAIMTADMIVIAPGNLYSSLLPALAVNGVRESIAASQGIKVMITNLVNKPEQTNGWHVRDYVQVIENYIGKNQLNYVLFNEILPDTELLEKYAADGEFPVRIEPGELDTISATKIGARLVASRIVPQDPNDTIIQRTLIRHDATKVRRLLQDILNQQK